MTALLDWQEQVAAFRRERAETDDQQWQRMAEWYDYNAPHNDEVETVLPRLLRSLDAGGRVLEIGPGTGVYTAPLASATAEVVAVEPSAAMRGVLARNLAKADITNTRIIPRRIEDALDEITGPFDLALASFCLYNVAPIDAVVRKLVSQARHTAVLMGTGIERDWSHDLYRQFRGKDRVLSPQFGLFYRVLLEMGIYADVEVIWVTSNVVFASEAAMTAWWGRLYGVEQCRYPELQSALLQHAERRGDKIGIYRRRRIVLTWIDTERSLPQ